METGGQRGKRETKREVWLSVNDDHHLGDDTNQSSSVETFALQYGNYLVSNIFSLFIKSQYPFRGSAEFMMTKCYYICMKSVNINGHIAVSFLIFRERDREWRARKVKCCV